MKQAIAATAWIAGLILTGAETSNFAWNMAGLILFAGSSYAIVWLRRGRP